jgi:hypothetical protein
MVFTNKHKLLTVNGTAFGSSETWSFGIRFVETVYTPNSQAIADACKAAVNTWWTSAWFPPATHSLAYVKLAPINPDGHYPPGEIAYIGDYVPDVAGGSTLNTYPAQTAWVCTLLGSLIPRGRGSHGRIYTPPSASALSSVGNWGTLNATMATAVATMIRTLNSVSGLGIGSIMSNLGTGITQPISSVRVDSKPDTQRRRAKGIVSTRASSAI